MEISGLLGFLRGSTSERHISDYRGKTPGIDASFFLYKGAYSCAEKIGLGLETSA